MADKAITYGASEGFGELTGWESKGTNDTTNKTRAVAMDNKGDEVALLETRPGELLCLLRDRQRKDIYRYWSRDGGRTWSERASIRDMLDCTLQRPFLTRVSDDVILLSGRDFGRKEVVAFVSRDGGRTFAERRTIDSYQGDGGYTAAVRLDDSSVRIVWYADRRATLNMPDVKAARLTIPARSVDASPLFSFGLVADVQYADKPDRPPRLYRDSLERLRECVTELNRHPLDFTIQLGETFTVLFFDIFFCLDGALQ